ncbi:nucleoside phosphorylase domain-containing protein [Talaromyces proteolyticus]|uniref:Nucleoside phosphorylase domain-containing protein n=1 Tax=Talaromyces proteolyticus TaxID=1131652 RepID=A0AAD4KVH5_9EURO|nr:nucleoside phosphorylase domain-containing protein [Talaromyces proteolyticus]KAH8700735.1 nucleoside phosphorylase domain-containing protein [Talaromyces proteolyticus]
MASHQQRSYADYTVGWICALPLEMAVAKAMLDEIHPRLPQAQNDHNIYTLGTLHGHNVVIACLPSGVYGYSSASTVAAQMLSAFPAVRFSLMVGIGGGVPGAGGNHADIRLGDVVVSKPTGTFGGVVQYDYGKTISRGRFKRTGTLNKPPSILLAALANLEADHTLGLSQIDSYLSQMLMRYPSLTKFASCPGPQFDILFEPEYHHIDSADGTCRSCNPRYLARRPSRPSGDGPQIHYGLIASGNRVMKDGLVRDRIARDLEDSVLCFEMEAAGLMDNFPCLVIRGISDYADSHKNKQWKPYAAAVAAAYAKELLSVIPVWHVRKAPLMPSDVPTSSDLPPSGYRRSYSKMKAKVPEWQSGFGSERDQYPASIQQGGTWFQGPVSNNGVIMGNINSTNGHQVHVLGSPGAAVYLNASEQ